MRTVRAGVRSVASALAAEWSVEMDSQQPSRSAQADARQTDVIRMSDYDYDDAWREPRHLAFALLPVITQQRLLFVRWLVETGRLVP